MKILFFESHSMTSVRHLHDEMSVAFERLLQFKFHTIGLFLQKNNTINGSLAERDLQFKASALLLRDTHNINLTLKWHLQSSS